MKVIDVHYLLPAMIDCEIGGIRNTVFVYINYKDRDIIVPDVTGISDIEQFKAVVCARVLRKTVVDKPPLPKEVHETIEPKAFKSPLEEEEEEEEGEE
jgi:hypothetical protein